MKEIHFTPGDLVTVKGDPAAWGEIVATAPSVERVQVKFANGAFWFHEAHLDLLAAGQDAPRAAEGVG